MADAQIKQLKQTTGRQPARSQRSSFRWCAGESKQQHLLRDGCQLATRRSSANRQRPGRGKPGGHATSAGAAAVASALRGGCARQVGLPVLHPAAGRVGSADVPAALYGTLSEGLKAGLSGCVGSYAAAKGLGVPACGGDGCGGASGIRRGATDTTAAVATVPGTGSMSASANVSAFSPQGDVSGTTGNVSGYGPVTASLPRHDVVAIMQVLFANDE
jgi:hypothetical protein